MKQCIAYIRPKPGFSPKRQRQEMQRYADSKGLEVVEWFIEQRRSALQDRPVFRRMLRAVSSGRASIIISDSRDRFSRKFSEWTEIANLTDRGAEFHFV